MFRKQDFKKLDLLGSGKRHTKIYKVQHLTTGQIYCLKEIETKHFEKLNEYKEEAVQLSKVQNLPNILHFYGYFFYQTNYNTYRLSLVTEYMDPAFNLEIQYTRRLKTGQHWTDNELTIFLFSLISACSTLQQKGICHRDIKPANLFMLPNSQAKLIDFGESKDYFFKQGYTMATIRGTPQYLSPILWKAHVLEGKSQYTKHNIYKSDVFSLGLVMCQIAMLKEVTGFNRKTDKEDGEVLLKYGLAEIERIYNKDFANIIGLLLVFEETQRLSFVELEYMFLEYEAQENSISTNATSPVNTNSKQGSIGRKGVSFGTGLLKGNELVKRYNKDFNTFNKNGSDSTILGSLSKRSSLVSPAIRSIMSPAENSINKSRRRYLNQLEQVAKEEETVFFDYKGRAYEPQVYWFEYGGKAIAKWNFEIGRWKIIGQSDKPFPLHFSVISIRKNEIFYLIGGQERYNMLEFSGQTMKITKKNNMIQARNFFASVYLQNKIYVFGGYDDRNKAQLKQSECFDLETETWSSIADLNIERSQAAACCATNEKIYIVGGYNSKLGTIPTIEEYQVKENRFILLDVVLREGLRRLSVRSFHGDMLIFGGLRQHFENNETVYKVDVENNTVEDCGTLEKGGVIECEVMLDNQDICYLFLEECNGTATPFHLKFQCEKKILDKL